MAGKCFSSGGKKLGRLGVAPLVLVAIGVFATPAAAEVGHRDHQFTPASPSSVVTPSGHKPQSKLWFNDGAWWGSLFRPEDESFHIHRLNAATDEWVDTGTVLDDRNSSKGDVLSVGSKLYVASASDSPGSSELRLYRYSYDPVTRTYTGDDLSSGTETYAEIGTDAGSVEALVLDRDSSGRLWVTYTKAQTVFVSHTQASDTDFVTPYALPGDEASGLDPDDLSAIVSFDGRIGVMWSNQIDSKMYFAEHVDDTGDSAADWSTSVAYDQGPGSADDHINLKSLSADPAGRVYAAVKTAFDGPPPQPNTSAQVNLLVLPFASGQWTSRTFGTVADDHTRPVVLTDQRRRRLYVLATSPADPADGVQTIYYKSASLDNPVFAPGLGMPLMQSDMGADINHVTSTKQDLSFAPGLVALAADPTHYWHNSLDLGAAPDPDPDPDPGSGGYQALPDRTAPRIGLLLRPSAFRATRRGGSVAVVRTGTAVALRLSEAARARFRVSRRVPGRRVAGRCRPRARQGGRRCLAPVRLRGAFKLAGRSGVNRFRFTGRLRRRTLRPGRYVLTVTAVDASGNRSASRSARFRIVK